MQVLGKFSSDFLHLSSVSIKAVDVNWQFIPLRVSRIMFAVLNVRYYTVSQKTVPTYFVLCVCQI